MKTFFTILTIALVAQCTFAASISRSKRSGKDALQVLREIVEEQKKMVDGVLKDLPKTPEYAPFKRTWESYNEVYNDNDLSCVVKIQGLVEGFGDIIANYKAPDAPADVKEVLALFNKHGLEAHGESLESRIKNIDTSKSVSC